MDTTAGSPGGQPLVLFPCVGRQLGESVFLRAKLRFYEAETSCAPFSGESGDIVADYTHYAQLGRGAALWRLPSAAGGIA